MIGKRIRAIRESKCISQIELAEITGISHDKICKVEAGKRRVTGAEIPLFANGLGVSVLELLEEDLTLPAPAGNTYGEVELNVL